jgi:hypothetical protein
MHVPNMALAAVVGLGLMLSPLTYAATSATAPATTTTASTTGDIAKLAVEFAKKVEMVDLGVCTPKPVSGTKYVCAAVPVKGAGLTPSPVICDSELGACYLAVSVGETQAETPLVSDVPTHQ